MLTRTGTWRPLLGLGVLTFGLALVLTFSGCAEKISGPGQSTRVNVVLDLKAGPTVSFRLTVSGTEMDTLSTAMVPVDNQVAALLSVPTGPDRLFLVEALDINGVALYSGEAVHDVVSLLPLELLIAMEPVVPLLYLNPHFAEVAVGEDFTVTINANDLPEVTVAGIGLSLSGLETAHKFSLLAYIDTLMLSADQIERGSTLTYDIYGGNDVYFTVRNKNPLFDEEGDGSLVIVHCRTQDIWHRETVDFTPQMYIEVLRGYVPPLDDVYLDSARYRLTRDFAPESYLGETLNDEGVALVGIDGIESYLAGNIEQDGFSPFRAIYLARVGSEQQPLWTRTLSWFNGESTRGLAQSSDGSLYLCGSTFSVGTVIRLDELGNEIWREDTRDIGGGSLSSIAARPNGGCVATGFWPNDGIHFYLAAFGPNGYEMHYAPANFSASQSFDSVVILDDTTFVAAGYENTFSDSDAVIAQFTIGESITQEWFSYVGGKENERASDLLVLDDGDYLIVGSSTDPLTGESDLFAARTDQNGNPRWMRSFGKPGSNEEGLGVCVAPDGEFVAAGSTGFVESNRDVYVVKFNGNGDLIWENILGGPAHDVAQDIVSTDSGFLVTGYSNPGPLGLRDILLLRLDDDGEKIGN